MDIRCDNGIKFGEVVGDFIEFKCRSKRCGKEGEVTIHRFTHQGEFVETRHFANPKGK